MSPLLAYPLLGITVGVLVRLIPGNRSMGWLGNAVLGALGAFGGGLLGSFATPDEDLIVVRLPGLIFAALGTLTLLVLVGVIRGWDARARAQLYPRPYRSRLETTGLLSQDLRSFETISKRYHSTDA